MPSNPPIRSANTALLGGNLVQSRDNGQSGAIVAGGLRSIAGDVQSAGRAHAAIENDRAAQYVAEHAPTEEVGMAQLLEDQKKLASSDSIDQFTANYRDSVDSMIEDAVNKAPPAAQDAMRARLMASSSRYAIQAVHYEAEQATLYQGQAFEKGAESVGAQLISDPSMLDQRLQDQFKLIDALSAPDSTKERYKDRTGQLLGVAAAEGLIMQDPHDALKQLNGGRFDTLVGPGDKATLIRRAETAIRSDEAAQRGEVTALKGAIVDEIGFLTEATRDGVRTQSSPEKLLATIEDQGLTAEMPRQVADLRLLASVSADTQAFRRDGVLAGGKRPEGMPVLAAMRATRDALVTADRTGRTRKSHMLVQSADAMIAQVEDRRDNDPMLGLEEAGIIDQPPRIDVQDPHSWQDVMGALDQARTYYGRSVTPYSTDQIKALRNFLDTQAPDAQAYYLSSMVTGMPDEMADSMARQVSKQDDPALAVAIGMAARGRDGVSAQILMGRKVMKADTFSLTKQDFNDAAKDLDGVAALADAPGALDEFMAAAKAVYAASVPQSTMMGSEAKVDPDLFEQALNAVMGGAPVNFNGHPLPPPVDGMTQTDFDAAIARIKPGDFTEFGRVKPPFQPFAEVGDGGIAMAPGTGTPGADAHILTPDDFRRAANLVPAADGIYYVRFGSDPLIGRDGLPYAFDMGAFLRDPQVTVRPDPPPPDRLRSDPYGNPAGAYKPGGG